MKTEMYLEEEAKKDKEKSIGSSNKSKVTKTNKASNTKVEPKNEDKNYYNKDSYGKDFSSQMSNKDKDQKPEETKSSKEKVMKTNKASNTDIEPKHEGVNERLFVLGGIEDILANEQMTQGASRALDILKTYMGNRVGDDIQGFIDQYAQLFKEKQ
jgi:hypothetical protein